MSKSTFQEDTQKLHDAWLDFFFALAKHSGLLRLVKKIPFLELKAWVRVRER